MPFLRPGFHHFHIRKRIHKKHEPYPPKDPVKRNYDRLIYIVVVAGPLFNIPQLLKVWMNESADGVSLFSWVGYAVVSIVWFCYGLIHKERPLVVMNVTLFATQIFIITGIIMYS